MMNVRERTQQIEEQILSPYASLSRNTKGRDRPEEECDLRTPYQRDRDRIIHCKAFRRLKRKTQVFFVARRRSLPDAPDPYIGGRTDRAYNRPGIAAE